MADFSFHLNKIFLTYNFVNWVSGTHVCLRVCLVQGLHMYICRTCGSSKQARAAILSSKSTCWRNCLRSEAPESLLYPGLCSLCLGPVRKAQLINLFTVSFVTCMCTETSSGKILVWIIDFKIDYRWRCLSCCLLSI